MPMHLIPKIFVLLLSITFLGACAKGPDAKDELASQGLFDAEFSSDGKSILIGSQLHGASLWSTSPLKRLFNWNHKQGEYSQITKVAISGNGSRAVTATGNEWVLWDTSNGKSLQYWQAGATINDISLNDSGSKAVIAQENGNVWLTDTRTGNNLKEFKHEEAVRSVALSPDEKQVLSGGDDYKAIVWDVPSGDIRHTIELENMCRNVEFSRSGKFAFVSSLRSDHLILATSNFEPVSTLDARYTIFNGTHFLSDDNLIASANQQGYIQVFDVQSGSEVERYKAERKTLFGGVRSLIDLHISGDAILAISSDGQLQRFSR